MKSFLMVFGFLAQAQAQSDNTETIFERTYHIRVHGGGFTCSEPLPPSGHNYPAVTIVKLRQEKYELVLSNIWTNIDEYTLSDLNFSPCSEYANLTNMKPSEFAIATVRQVVTETLGKNFKGQCLRHTREESFFTIKGVELRGLSMFSVGPLPPEKCD